MDITELILLQKQKHETDKERNAWTHKYSGAFWIPLTYPLEKINLSSEYIHMVLSNTRGPGLQYIANFELLLGGSTPKCQMASLRPLILL